MKKIVFLKSSYLFTCLFLLLSSCSNNDDDVVVIEDANNIVETAQGTDILSSLVAALIKADENENSDLVGTLSAEGSFTVFAPTNEAFTNLLNGLEGYDSLEDFDTPEKRELLATILKYHVVGAKAMSSDLNNGQSIATIQGENLMVNIEVGVFIKDATEINAEVISADIEASNGVVHVINKVLIPQAVLDALETEAELKNIVEIAVATDDLSILVGALQQANDGLVDVLSGTGPFTVFAPTNEAFVELLESLGDDYNGLADFDTEEEQALLVKILTYHVVGNVAALSTDLSAGQMIETVQGEEVTINLDGGSVFIEDATDIKATVLTADVMASNGVVHVIDKVLLPQEVLDALKPNIVGLAQTVDDLSLLVDALIQADAGLVDVLSGDGPFTVFAPTNEAFAALLETLGNDYNSLADFDTEDEKALLAKILTYHVVSGAKVLSSELTDGQTVETVQSEDITISIHDGVFVGDATDDDATVTTADVVASNGVVHIINKVLLPQEVLDLLGH